MRWLIFIFTLLAFGCTNKKIDVPFNSEGYPADIGQIVLGRCATAGCHNGISRAAAANLNMETYDALFEGSYNNAAVIPYCSSESFLLSFINSYEDLGPIISPLMPYGGTPLTREEVILFKTWIDNGAPDKDGNIMFADNANRRKILIGNQGCDLLTVFDINSGVSMRCEELGAEASIEAPHQIKVSPDNKYWYAVFTAGAYVQKFDAATDKLVDQCDISFGNWNTFAMTSDGKIGFAVEWETEGRIAAIDLETMELLVMYQGAGLLIQPHGSMMDPTDRYLYVAAQTGNYMYKIDITDIQNPDIEQVTLDGQSASYTSSFDPHEIIFSPDGTKYFVTCQGTNEVRVMDAATDAFITSIPVGVKPQEFALSTTTNYLFVSCTEDSLTYPGKIGSVAVIDYTSNSFVKSIHSGYQPHGMAVDDVNGAVYVGNRNVNVNGPAPHHTTDCGGRNGYMTKIDMNSLSLSSGFRVELSVDPYAVAIRN